MSVFNLNAWLRKTPKPVAVMADNQRIEVPRHGRSWHELTATIQALEPDKVSCLDGQGAVLRSKILNEDEAPIAHAPEQSEIETFARLIAEAYDKASKSNQPILDSAMQMVERLSARLAKSEAENDRLRNQVIKLTQELVSAPEEPPEPSIAEALAQGVLVRELEERAKANGAPAQKGEAQ